ncbi:MAG: nucleotidyltransferase domain-containing protein [Candidatus Bathyarchaeota archaeon]|nr:nucleotidyltransferase domain-containing protein [Candidatus Bathyarchaeota archaeon]
MADWRKVTRGAIVEVLARALEPLDYAYAFWEGGAAALGRLDEWSDIDLYLVVDDDRVDAAFQAAEEALASLSPIAAKLDVPHPPGAGIFQAFYKLKAASEYHLVDLAILKASSPDKFLEPEIHGRALFYFNKGGRIKPPPFDRDKFARKLEGRLRGLCVRFGMFENYVQKEINRRNHLEAVYFYHMLLAMLVEALRMKYYPVHHGFKMRYIHYELPNDIIQRLKPLYFLDSEEDLQRKYKAATSWFHELTSNMDEIRSRIKRV